MKILLISNMYPSKKYPHYGVFVENTLKVLEDQGYNLDKIILTKQDKKIIKIIQYMLFYFKIIIKLILNKYDVVYGHYISHIALPILIALKIRKSIKLILNVHGNDVVPEKSSDYKFIPLVEKILKRTDKLIIPSSYYSKIMKEKYNFNENKMYIYPSGGIDHDIFKCMDKESICNHFNLKSNYIYIGFVSRIEVNKGWDVFLKAAEMILNNKNNKDNIRFIVVGNGNEIDKYDILVNKLKLRDYIYKFDLLDQQEVAKIYNILDIFCFPTHRKSESLGLVGLEAMACGCVVIASNMGGPSSYINDGKNGFLFEAKNYKKLADCINNSINLENEKKNKIIDEAKKTSEKYDKNLVKEHLLKLFQ